MLFEYAEQPPPVFMTQSIHILKGGARTHAHAQFRLGAYNGLDLMITDACVVASNVATGFSTMLLLV